MISAGLRPTAAQWEVPGLRNTAGLSHSLQGDLAQAFLFRRIATCETDVPVGTVEEWRWTGPQAAFAERAAWLGLPELARRAEKLAATRA